MLAAVLEPWTFRPDERLGAELVTHQRDSPNGNRIVHRHNSRNDVDPSAMVDVGSLALLADC